MRTLKSIPVIATLVFAACSNAGEPSRPFPQDDTATFLMGTLLEVPRSGPFLWNTMPISDGELSDFLRRYITTAGKNARVVLQAEPGTPPNRIALVRKRVIDEGFCRIRRCFEAPWRSKRPVVN